MGMELQNGNSATAQNKIQRNRNLKTDNKNSVKTHPKNTMQKKAQMGPRRLDESRMAETERKSGKEGFFTPLYFT